MSKRFMQIIFLLLCSIIYSQGVIEYNKKIPVNFFISEESDKIFKNSEIEQINPEFTVQSYFFATDSTSLNTNFLDKNDYLIKDEKHYEGIKSLKNDKNYIIILHKFFYKHNGNEMCYINFIFKLENIDFTIPTNLSLIKKDNKWYIYQLGNQIELNEVLWRLKSCVLSDLINGNVSQNEDLNDILKKVWINNSLNISSLYDQLINWGDSDLNKFTLKENNDCSITKKEVEGIVTTTFLFDNVKIELLKNSQNKDLKKELGLELYKLDSRLTIKIGDKIYDIIKYKDGEIFKYKVLNSNKLLNPVEEFFFLFKNLDSVLLYNLFFQSINPNVNDKNYKIIYEKTRGQLNCLNSSKLYSLFKSNNIHFSEYKIN